MEKANEISDWLSDWLNQKFITMKGFTQCDTDDILNELKAQKNITIHDKKILFELSNRHGLAKMLRYFISQGVDIN